MARQAQRGLGITRVYTIPDTDFTMIVNGVRRSSYNFIFPCFGAFNWF